MRSLSDMPEQGNMLGLKVSVIFDRTTNEAHNGVIVRDDIRFPWVTIIRLDSGECILERECSYREREGARRA